MNSSHAGFGSQLGYIMLSPVIFLHAMKIIVVDMVNNFKITMMFKRRRIRKKGGNVFNAMCVARGGVMK